MRRLTLLLLLPLCSCSQSDSVRISTARMHMQEAAYRAGWPDEMGFRLPWEIHGSLCRCTYCEDERKRDK